MQNIFQPIILAGGPGQGQEVYPLCEKYPKALLPINNKPLILYHLEQLEKSGYESALILSTSQFKEQIEKCLQEQFHGKIKYEIIAIPDDKKETLQAIKFISNRITSDFILIPSDLVSDIDLDLVAQQHLVQQSHITLVLKEDVVNAETNKVKNSSCQQENHDIIVLNNENNNIVYIQSFEEIKDHKSLSIKKSLLANNPNVSINTHLVDSHLYFCSHSILQLLDKLDPSVANTLESFKDNLIPFLVKNQVNQNLLNLLQDEEKLSIKAFISKTAYVRRVNNIKDYFKANFDSLSQQQPSSDSFKQTFVNNNVSQLIPDSNLMIENSSIVESARIGSNSRVTQSLIGQNCVIGEGVQISDSIIMNGSIIENGCILKNSILCTQTHIKQGSQLEECWVSHKVVVSSNSTLSAQVVDQSDNDN